MVFDCENKPKMYLIVRINNIQRRKFEKIFNI